MVTPAWPPGGVANGIVTYTGRMAPAFREHGARPILLSWQHTPPLREPGNLDSDVVEISGFQTDKTLAGKIATKVSRLWKGAGSRDARHTMIERAVGAALSRYPIEVLEIEEAFGLASCLVQLNRVPIVTRLHGPWFLNGEVLGVKKDAAFAERLEQERLSILCADGVTAPSQDVLERTRRHYGLPLEGARVIPCPIDVQESDPAWKLSVCDRNRIVFVGRFDLHKGADVLIEAFSRFAERRPALVLDFIGPDRGVLETSGNTVRIDEFLQSRVPDSDIRRRIIVHGEKPASQVDAFRLRALVTVVPSRYETFGYTAAEALRLGCPLVACDAGGLSEIVRDNETGLLCRPGDAHSLSSQIERLCCDPEFAARLGAAARLDIRGRYNSGAIAETTLDFYALTVEQWTARRTAHRHPADPPGASRRSRF